MNESYYSYNLERNVLSLFFSLPVEERSLFCYEIKDEDFYSNSNKIVFNAIKQLLDNGGAVNVVAVNTVIQESTDSIPEHYVMAIFESSCENNNLNKDYFVQQLIKYSALRKLHNVGEKLVSGLNPEENLSSILETIDKDFTGAFDTSVKSPVSKIGEQDFETRIKEMIANPSTIVGLETGMHFFDVSFGGIVPGRLTLIGGRPGAGKSALGENLAYNFSILRQHPTLLLDTETSKDFVENRLLSISTGLDFNVISKGQVPYDDIAEHVKLIEKSNLYYSYMPSLNVKELYYTCKKYKKLYDIKAVIVDFLGSAETDNMYLEVGQKVKEMHNMAVELEISFVVLQQLSREQLDKTSGKGVKEISLGHFVQSDMSTWYPDSIAGIRLPTTGEKGKYGCNRIIDVPKNRFGPPNLVWPLNFTGGSMRFEDIMLFD